MCWEKHISKTFLGFFQPTGCAGQPGASSGESLENPMDVEGAETVWKKNIPILVTSWKIIGISKEDVLEGCPFLLVHLFHRISRATCMGLKIRVGNPAETRSLFPVV